MRHSEISAPVTSLHGEGLPTQQSFEEAAEHAVVRATGISANVASERAREPSWVLVDEGFTLAREHEVESLFAIGNGYIGNRGSLAEGSPLSSPATFVAGVFEKDDKPGSVPALLVLPDWTGVRALIEGQPLSMEQGTILQHFRLLDMRRGILWREWRQKDPNGRITRIIASRLASLADRHLLIQSVVITPENYSGMLQLESAIELAANLRSYGMPEEWKTRHDATRPNILPIGLMCPGTDVTIAIGTASQVLSHDNEAGRREIEAGERRISEWFEVPMELGGNYRLDRLISVYTSRDGAEPLNAVVAHLNQYFPGGARRAVDSHAHEWRMRWNDSDVQVAGDETLQRALRFAIYHLISCANPADERVSIGARALTGEAYKGHVFWDTEVYMLPFYDFTHPPSARALLMYRHMALPAAREKAKAAGYRGAMYPWESADTGEETTPRFVIDPKGRVIEVLNGEMEVHITADVAYAVWQYWEVTNDVDFLLQAGMEIMLETARFWASRGKVESDGRYHIRNVIGPDEYHENVDDNAYTNMMAAWNMRQAAKAVELVRRRWAEKCHEICKRLQVTDEEIASWNRLGDNVYTGLDQETKLFEQFTGYYGKEPVDLAAYEPRHSAMDVILGHDRIQQTNIVKQADVVMAMCLLWNEFAPEVREKNFHYYEPRTGHGSSLSPSMHALMAARIGDMEKAERYLKQASEIDLGNNMGNAAGGVHAAAIGGLWQALVFGFAGMEPREDGLRFGPHLPAEWQHLAFPVQWRGRKLRVWIEPELIRFDVEEGHGDLIVGVTDGPEIVASSNYRYEIQRLGNGWGEWRQSALAAHRE